METDEKNSTIINFLNLSIIAFAQYEYYYSVSIENTNILSSCLINKTTLDRCILLSISNFPLFDILANETRWKHPAKIFI